MCRLTWVGTHQIQNLTSVVCRTESPSFESRLVELVTAPSPFRKAWSLTVWFLVAHRTVYIEISLKSLVYPSEFYGRSFRMGVWAHKQVASAQVRCFATCQERQLSTTQFINMADDTAHVQVKFYTKQAQ